MYAWSECKIAMNEVTRMNRRTEHTNLSMKCMNECMNECNNEGMKKGRKSRLHFQDGLLVSERNLPASHAQASRLDA